MAVTGANAGIQMGFLVHENGWEDEMNKNLRLVDALLQGLVLDKDLATPPVSPTMGDLYIVAASPTGAWAGQAGKLAVWTVGSDITSAWVFITPKKGWKFYVSDENLNYLYDGTNWINLLTAAKGSSNGITIGDVSTNSNAVLRLQGTSAGPNWQIANNLNFAGIEITPSTTNGGTTYTTPAITLTSAGALTAIGPIKAQGYTVATLPAGVVGQRAYVTDASSPVFGSAVVGGGSTVIPVFRNATTWIVG